MDISAGHLITFAAGVLGVGVGYGGLRAIVGFQKARINGLEETIKEITGNPGGNPIFTRRTDCDKTVEILQKALSQIGREVEGIRNYHIWDLTKNKNMGLKEAKELLNAAE